MPNDKGEQVVQAAFDDTTLIRPTVMFGPGDAFLTPILDLLRKLPAFPLFAKGLMRQRAMRPRPPGF